MTAMTDDRLDLEIVAFLRQQADDVYGAPDSGAMAWRLSAAERSMRRRLDRLVARPVVRLALVAMLLAAVVSATLIVGAARRGMITNGPIVLSPALVLDPSTGRMSAGSICGGRCADAVDVAFSRDGQVLAFVDPDGLSGDTQTGGAGMSIWRYDRGSDRPRLLVACPPAGACGRPSFSVDGRQLAYGSADWADGGVGWEMVVIDLATGQRQSVPHPEGDGFWMSWTDDGRIVTSIQPGSDPHVRRTYLIDPANGATFEPVDRWPFTEATASPDGSTIAYLSYVSRIRTDGIVHPEDRFFEIWASDVDGSNLRQLYRGGPANIGGQERLVWSPDGRQIAFGLGMMGGDPHVWILDTERGGQLQSLDGTPRITAWPPAG
jgi:hypothetical protein